MKQISAWYVVRAIIHKRCKVNTLQSTVRQSQVGHLSITYYLKPYIHVLSLNLIPIRCVPSQCHLMLFTSTLRATLDCLGRGGGGVRDGMLRWRRVLGDPEGQLFEIGEAVHGG